MHVFLLNQAACVPADEQYTRSRRARIQVDSIIIEEGVFLDASMTPILLLNQSACTRVQHMYPC